MTSKPIILIIDDNKYPTIYYVRELEQEGFIVKHVRDPDKAFEFIATTKPSLVISDIMMPPGERYQDKDKEGGLMTGYFIYSDLRALYPELPIIILTNMMNEKRLAGFPIENNLKVLKKLECLPDDLLEIVYKMIHTNNRLS
jgi:CheY-like chemotaxis protein